MLDLVVSPEDRFSSDAAHIKTHFSAIQGKSLLNFLTLQDTNHPGLQQNLVRNGILDSETCLKRLY